MNGIFNMYHCQKCDAQYPKWAGKCDTCHSWGTIGEGSASAPTTARKAKEAAAQKSARLFEVAKAGDLKRTATKDPEIDRVLGGGIVPGSVILLSGEPGIGKSTMVASIASAVADKEKPVLYISGEESAEQLAGRFSRMECPLDHIHTLEPFPVETLVATIEKEKPALAIIDSVQTLTSSELDSAAGGATLVRYAASLLIELAKRTHIPILLIGQVTKDGSVAGPKTLEHLVDVVLSLDGDPVHAYRLLRANKNRFGGTDEIGVFHMTGKGLVAVENPSEQFLKERVDVPGSVITAILEGSRVFLVEVQALVEKTTYGTPVRRASGFDQNRLQMLSAILSKRAGIKLSERDIYVNVIGGMNLKEPAADLAVCAAILSAEKDTATKKPTLFVGEVGLGGEVRSIPLLDRRLQEAKRYGLENIVTPKTIKTVKDLL